MGKINVEIDAEAFDDAMVWELLETRLSLLQDYMKGTTGVFSFDLVEERIRIGELIRSVERVIEWFSVPGTYEFDALPAFDTESGELYA
jgi:hypothetical protein